MDKLKVITLCKTRSQETKGDAYAMTNPDVESLNVLHRYLLEIMINEEVKIGNKPIKCSDIEEIRIRFE